MTLLRRTIGLFLIACAAISAFMFSFPTTAVAEVPCINTVYNNNCTTGSSGTSGTEARMAQISQVNPRQCAASTLFNALAGYSTEGDTVVYTSEAVPGMTQVPGSGQFSTVYRDGAPIGTASTTLNVLGWQTFPNSPSGVHTYRVDTYFEALIPTGSTLGYNVSVASPAFAPQTRRGRDVTITSPDASCSPGNSGGGSAPTPTQPTAPQSIALQTPQASCAGTVAQVPLAWSSTLTRNQKQLTSRDDTGLAGALEVAYIAPIEIPLATVQYQVFRDSFVIANNITGTTYADAAAPAGSHTYYIAGVSSSYNTYQSEPKTVTVPDCGGNTPTPPTPVTPPVTVTPPTMTVQIQGAGAVKPNQTYQYCAILNGLYIPSGSTAAQAVPALCKPPYE